MFTRSTGVGSRALQKNIKKQDLPLDTNTGKVYNCIIKDKEEKTMLTREQMNEIYEQIRQSREQTKRVKEIIARADIAIEDTRRLIEKTDKIIARTRRINAMLEKMLAE